MRILFTLLSLSTLIISNISCQSPPLPKMNIDNLHYSDMSEPSPVACEDFGSFAFKQCPLSVVVQEISRVYNVSCIISNSIAGVCVDGVFKNLSLDMVVSSVSRSANLTSHFISDRCVVFTSADNAGDVESVIVTCPAPFMDMDAIRTDEKINCQLLNGVLIISGERNDVKNYIRAINELNNNFVKSYAVEINIVRISRSNYFDLAADLKLSTQNLLTLTSLTDLVSLVASVDGNFDRNNQMVSSFLYLTEGQESSLDVGTVRQRELRNISTEGYTSTSGFKEFRDGLELKLSCSALSNGLYCLQSDITQSKFRESSDKNDIVPINDTSAVKSNRVIVADNRYCVLAALNDTSNIVGLRFFGGTRSDSDSMIIIFCKVKRVNPSTFGSNIFDIIALDCF